MQITKYSQSTITLPPFLENKVKNIKGMSGELLEDCLTITLLIHVNYPRYITIEDIRLLSGICLSRIKLLLSVLLRIGLIKVVNVQNRIEAVAINKAQLDEEQPMLRRWLKRFDYCNFPNKEHAALMRCLTPKSIFITLLVVVVFIIILFAAIDFI